MKELLELEAKNAVSIEEEIENERKKVDAKTPITEEVSIYTMICFIKAQHGIVSRYHAYCDGALAPRLLQACQAAVS